MGSVFGHSSWGCDQWAHLQIHTPERCRIAEQVPWIPHVLAEICSMKDETDRYRMLIQAACAIRLAHFWKAKSGNFIIMAIYVDAAYNIKRHLLCQVSEDKSNAKVSHCAGLIPIAHAATRPRFTTLLTSLHPASAPHTKRTTTPSSFFSNSIISIVTFKITKHSCPTLISNLHHYLFRRWTESQTKHSPKMGNQVSKKWRANPGENNSFTQGGDALIGNKAVVKALKEKGFTELKCLLEDEDEVGFPSLTFCSLH
jgi:hypothetical protein